MKDLTKYFIDLSKLSEEQRNEIEKVTGFSLIANDYPYLIWLNGRWDQGVKYHIKDRTELTYPEFIKLFEDGEVENKCCDNPDIQWNKIEINIGDKQGSYKDLNFNFCDNCGETFNEVFD